MQQQYQYPQYEYHQPHSGAVQYPNFPPQQAPPPVVYGAPGAPQQPYNPPSQPMTATSVHGFHNHGHSHGSGFNDLEGGACEDLSKMLHSDLSVSIRHAFIRKVYAILSYQLVITFGLALMFSLWDRAAIFLITHVWLFIVATIVNLILLLVLICAPGVSKKVPLNYFLVSCISVLFGVTMGYLAIRVSVWSFLMALGLTAAVVIAITIFACQTKIDFTGFAPYALVFLLILILFGIVAAIFRSRITNLLYGALGALLFSFYLIIDTQMIVGGKHVKYQYTIDDYILAAMSLYIDILNLFSYILMIMQNS